MSYTDLGCPFVHHSSLEIRRETLERLAGTYLEDADFEYDHKMHWSRHMTGCSNLIIMPLFGHCERNPDF